MLLMLGKVLSSAILIFFFLAGCNTNKEQFNLTSKSYEIWRDYITPSENELLWTSIPWRSSFREGLIDADDQYSPYYH